jgi:hypothetical protein
MRTRYLLLGVSLALASCASTKKLPHYTEAEKQAQRESIGFWKPDPLKEVPKLSPAAKLKLEARRRRGQAPTPLAGDGGTRPLDSVVVVPYAQPQPGRSTAFWQKLNPFRSKPATSQKLLKPTSISSFSPAKVKNSTVNVYYGKAKVTNSTVGKKGNGATGDGAGVTTTDIGKNAGPAVVGDASTQHALTGGGNLAAQQGNGNSAEQTKQDTIEEASGWQAELAKPTGKVIAGVVAVLLVGGCIYLIVAYKRRKALQA